jgi:hypothetical protein
MLTSVTERRTAIRGGSETQFPGKLHDMMTYIQNQGLESIVSWTRNGRGIMVHNPEKLLDTLLPLFFGQSKYRSFQRQLNMWHFERILEGPDRGAFMHPNFVRGNKSLCAYMSRHLFVKPPIPDSLLDSKIESHRNRVDHENNRWRWQNDTESFLSKDMRGCHQDSIAPVGCVVDPMIIAHDASTDCMDDFNDGDQASFAGRQSYFLDETNPAQHICATPLEDEKTIDVFSSIPLFLPSLLGSLLEPLTPDTLESIFHDDFEGEQMYLPRLVTPLCATREQIICILR